MTTKIISVLVLDKPAVLARVATLVSRRGYNIASLAVGATEAPGRSRVTLVVDADEASTIQLRAQLLKLVDVLEADEVGPSASRHQLVLVRCADPAGLDAARDLGAHVEDSVVVLTSADSSDVLVTLRPYGTTVVSGGLVSLP